MALGRDEGQGQILAKPESQGAREGTRRKGAGEQKECGIWVERLMGNWSRAAMLSLRGEAW